MTKIQDLYTIFLSSSGVSTDTRNIKPNSVFFALKGVNFDGNVFAQQALDSGAKYAVVDDNSCQLNEQIILVDDVLKTLQELANYHRRYLKIPVLGITGSNGKTTTKELINEVLKKKYHTYATQGNLNNHIGVPLTLLSIDKSVEFGIVEMGANHPGEIHDLCLVADPDFGLITNVGKAHLEGFGSFDGVKKTKAELYRHIENKNGIVFINDDNKHLKSMLKDGAKKIAYGKCRDLRVSSGDAEEGDFLAFTCSIGGAERLVKTHLIGDYNRENVLAALCIGDYFGVEYQAMLDAIENYLPTNNRSQLVVTSKNKVLFDAYNANPTSMKVALQNFQKNQGVNKFVILGEMKELGQDSGMEHKDVVTYVNENFGSNAFFIGKNYEEHMSDVVQGMHFESVQKVIEYLSHSPMENYYILVKGSRTNQLEKLKEVL